MRSATGFNEAAGFTRRKRNGARCDASRLRQASMRPPDLPGGNGHLVGKTCEVVVASMRPPDLPGGNTYGIAAADSHQVVASMRPPDLPGGNDGQLGRHRHPARASMRPPDLPGGNVVTALRLIQSVGGLQ